MMTNGKNSALLAGLSVAMSERFCTATWR